MLPVLRSSWALLLGLMLLMVGNGLQGTLLGVRGALEGFSTVEMSVIMSAYFVGFLFGSQLAPGMIRRVGHVRVFAALGSFVSACLILFPAITDPIAWTLLRVAVGFCFSGVYITAESWLNNATTNETRGQALSLYVMVQMVGIILAQVLVGAGDPSGFILFIIPSVLVSIAFAPILLSIAPTPAFDSTKPMSLRQVYQTSPLGVVGIVIMGGVYSAMFGMSGVYGTQAGLNVAQISTFVGAIYLGGMLLQYPIGWMSDRADRRGLIIAVAMITVAACGFGMTGMGGFPGILVSGFLIGGMANPMYALLLAYINDYLDNDDMAAASARLMFLNGLGAIAGPLVLGALMDRIGPAGFFLFIGALMAVMSVYGLWRMTRRASPGVADSGTFTPLPPTTTPVVLDLAQEVWIEASETAEAEAEAEAVRSAG
jgi:MFS family permease